MTISEQIKVLCVRNNISVAELERIVGKSPQNFNSKLIANSLRSLAPSGNVNKLLTICFDIEEKLNIIFGVILELYGNAY